jgi:hypothetical protein
MIKNQITQQTFDDIIIIMVKDNLQSLFETDFKDSCSSLEDSVVGLFVI